MATIAPSQPVCSSSYYLHRWSIEKSDLQAFCLKNLINFSLRGILWDTHWREARYLADSHLNNGNWIRIRFWPAVCRPSTWKALRRSSIHSRLGPSNVTGTYSFYLDTQLEFNLQSNSINIRINKDTSPFVPPTTEFLTLTHLSSHAFIEINQESMLITSSYHGQCGDYTARHK